MKSSSEIRDQILALAQEYHEARQKERPPFVAGQSRIDYAGRVYDQHEICNLLEASLDFWLTHGRYSQDFEQQLAQVLGVKWSLFVNSGSSANLLAFSALCSPELGEKRIQPGDEVITVAASFPTTIAPIVQNKAVPVFVDIDPVTANIDIAAMRNALSKRTKAVMAAHTLGNPMDLNAIVQFCEDNNLWLVEDNCDALGSTYNGKATGSFGHISTCSFYPAHHITTGEGGAVCTSHPQLRRIMLSLRDWGRSCFCGSGEDNSCGNRFSGQHGTLPFGYDHKYVYSHLGYNLKATDLQAAIGLAQLHKLPDFIQARKRNHAALRQLLAPYSQWLHVQDATPQSDPSWFGCLITVLQTAPFTRNEITAYLEKQKIQTRTLFAGNIVRQPAFQHLLEGIDYRISGTLDNTDSVMENAFWIGVYPGMDDDKSSHLSHAIIRFLNP